jgi:hypothetical protein
MKTLMAYHSPLQVDLAGPEYRIDPNALDGYNSGWEKIGLPTQGVFLSAREIDCAGLDTTDKSIFFDAASIQTPSFTCSQSGVTAGDFIQIIDAVSTIPLDVANNPFDPTFYGFGMPGGKLGNHEHVIYGRAQRWSSDLDHNAIFPVLIETNTFGSMEPSASDTLYVYRWVYFSAPILTVGSVTGARIMFGMNVRDEPLYVQLMRMRRSYELQQEPDRD